MIDTSKELLLQRYGKGLRLVRPDRISRKNTTGYSLSAMAEIPLNFYLYDLDNHVQFSNEQNTRLCGWDSSKEFLGKHVSQLIETKSANQLIHNNRMIQKANAFKIIDEYLIQPDSMHFNALTLKFPWLNDKNRVIGIIGFSIPFMQDDKASLAPSLSLLVTMGLLNAPISHQPSSLPGLIIDNTYFSKRETEVLFHLVRGKTAKQIGEKLGISARTVETHSGNAKNRIGAQSKSELIERIFHCF